MKAKTYASLATILFVVNDKRAPSIEETITYVDMLAKKLGIKVDVSMRTKYRVIQELITSGIFEAENEFANKKVGFSKKLEKYIDGKVTIIIN